MIKSMKIGLLVSQVLLFQAPFSYSAPIESAALCPGSNGLIHYEQTVQNMFTPDASGKCGATVNTLDYCHDKLCIFWKQNPADAPFDQSKVLKALNILQNYIDFGSMIMNYDPTTNPYKTFTGNDGKTRRWVIEFSEELCAGYGGASYNGRAWNALPKSAFQLLYSTIDSAKPTVHQVFWYEMGRSIYDTRLDDILDWQMNDASRYGYWTLGFNGAMTVLGPEALNVNMDYFGYNTAMFRAARIKDIDTYINNSQWNFDNAWSVWLLPWSPSQSINDMMSGLLIKMSDQFGGTQYLSRLFYWLKMQPKTANKTDRKARAGNLYAAARLAYKDLKGDPTAIDRFFKTTLRWTFLPNLSE